jgi:thymidylate synthase
MRIKSAESVDAWKTALKFILEKGNKYLDHRKKVCYEVENLVITVNSCKNIDRPIRSLRRFSDIEFPPLEEIEDIFLLRKEVPRYIYSYGARIFNFSNTFNQIDDYIIPLLQKYPVSRRATICFMDVLKDLEVGAKDLPALVSITFTIREGKLNATAFIRSNDLFFGWPANIFQIYSLQKYITKILGCEIGSITTVSVSAHVYEEQIAKIKQII